MKNTRFTESQIIKSLRENELGRKLEDNCREMGIHNGTFYNCRKSNQEWIPDGSAPSNEHGYRKWECLEGWGFDAGRGEFKDWPISC